MKAHAVQFKGGLSLEASLMSGDPGALMEAINYESAPTGGYRTTRGYLQQFQFPGYDSAANEKLQQLAYHPALAAGYIVAGNDENGPGVMWTLYDNVTDQTVTWRLATGTLPARVEYTHSFTGVFVHSGTAKHWAFFVSRGGRIDAVVAEAPEGNPFLTESSDVTTFSALRAADAATDYIDSYGISHANHAWVTSGRSVFCSALGDPTDWTTALSGAAEFRMDADIVGLTTTAGGVLLVYTSRGIFGIYGTDADSFELRRVVSDVRVLPRSVQDLSVPIFAAEGAGLMSLQTAQEFGDFSAAGLSTDIRDLLRKLGNPLGESGSVVASYVDPNESQYHLIYQQFDGTQRHICVPIYGGQALGATFIEWPHDIRFFARLRLGGDTSVSVFPMYGADGEGRIYRMAGFDDGSFNNQPIRSFLSTRFTHCGSPGVRKRFRRVRLELDTFTWQVDGDPFPPVEVQGFAQFDANDPESPSHPMLESLYTVGVTLPGYWDTSEWNSFRWVGQTFQFATMSVNGTGETFALVLASERQFGPGHTVMGYIVEYDERRRIRG